MYCEASYKWNFPRLWRKEQKQEEKYVEIVKEEASTEVDVENLEILAIERFNNGTIFRLKSMKEDPADIQARPLHIKCSLQEHNAYIIRFRVKLGLQ